MNYSSEELADHIAGSVEKSRSVEKPFYHLEFDRVFPEDLYARMVQLMPGSDDYRALPGRHGVNLQANGKSTRIKLDLFPEFTCHLAAEKRAIWSLVGQALCSRKVKESFVRRLAPGLEKRFGNRFLDVGMYPIPILTRDFGGYNITPHTDTHWKGITVQFYLPPDDSTLDIGTVFHDQLPDGSLPKATRMKFAPNSGYAFAVHNDTWHSADKVRPDVTSRDSILLTYFVDSGPLRFLRNRSKRVGNCLLNEFRYLFRRQ